MIDAIDKLAKILNVKTEILSDLDAKLSAVSGAPNVPDKIVAENDSKISARLAELGLNRQNSFQEIAAALNADLIEKEKKLLVYTGGVDLNTVAQKALALVNPGTGFFIKKTKALAMLKQNPPPVMLNYFACNTVEELVAKEDLVSVFCALRFTESSDWMNKVFIQSYQTLTLDDFEERPVETIVLDAKWLKIAEKFLKKKYHNISHLKELGIIFVIPLAIDTDGELLRVFTLLLHYLNEVPFYSSLFKKYGYTENFPDKLRSLLRGDVIKGELNPTDQSFADVATAGLSHYLQGENDLETSVKEQRNVGTGKFNIRIVQRYLAKENPDDPRLFEPRINPEAEHWFKAQANLAQLPGFENIVDYDFVGDFFGGKLVSFDLIDLIMSLVAKTDAKYLYHQPEALWNKLFMEYLGRDKVNQLVGENIIKGFIKL